MKNTLTYVLAILLAGNLPTARGDRARPRPDVRAAWPEGGTPVTGHYDFTFKFFDAPAGGSQVGGTFITNGLQVVMLATAILRLWPEARFAGGPPAQKGFIATAICRIASRWRIARASRRR